MHLEFLKAHNQGGGSVPAGRGPLTSAYAGWTLSEDLEDMDRSGTATAILSITTPGFYFAQKEEARKIVRECNGMAAKLPKRPAWVPTAYSRPRNSTQ